MVTTPLHPTAKIYEFPQKARAASRTPRRGDGLVVDLRPEFVAAVEFGSGWYHDAAIREAEQQTKQ